MADGTSNTGPQGQDPNNPLIPNPTVYQPPVPPQLPITEVLQDILDNFQF